MTNGPYLAAPQVDGPALGERLAGEQPGPLVVGHGGIDMAGLAAVLLAWLICAPRVKRKSSAAAMNSRLESVSLSVKPPDEEDDHERAGPNP